MELGKEEKEKSVELQQWRKKVKINNNKQDLTGEFEDSEHISNFKQLKIGKNDHELGLI